MDDAYAVAADTKHQKVYFGSERDGGLITYDLTSGETEWIDQTSGGHMTILPYEIEGEDIVFVISEFKPIYQSEGAMIQYYRRVADGWACFKVAHMPFVHRIGVLKTVDGNFLVTSTLCGKKAFQNDWSIPGAIYVTAIPEKLDDLDNFKFEEIFSPLSRNHGMSIVDLYQEGKEGVLVSGVEGAFYIRYREGAEREWEVDQILQHEISQVIALDFDYDGELELATIEPFHGDTFSVYKKLEGQWERKVLNVGFHFGHVLEPFYMNGQAAILYGWRGDNGGLGVSFCTSKWPFQIERQMIGEKIYPANSEVFHIDDKTYLAAASVDNDEAYIYILERN